MLDNLCGKSTQLHGRRQWDAWHVYDMYRWQICECKWLMKQAKNVGRMMVYGLWCLMPLLTIFQLYRGSVVNHFFQTLAKMDWNKYSPKWNRARHVWRVTFFLNFPTNTKCRILRTIGRYFSFLNTLAWPIVHIDLYKDEVKKIWNPSK